MCCDIERHAEKFSLSEKPSLSATDRNRPLVSARDSVLFKHLEIDDRNERARDVTAVIEDAHDQASSQHCA